MVGLLLAYAERGLCPFHNLDGCGRREHGTDIDSHIEEAEAAVALVGILWCVIELANHNLEVALEESRSETYEHQCHTESYDGRRAGSERNGEQHVADEHDDDARCHHLAKTETVGCDTANDGKEVDHHQECGVDAAGRAGSETEIGLKIKNEYGQHGVIAKPLAGVGQCQRIKTFGLSFKHNVLVLMLLIIVYVMSHCLLVLTISKR